MVWLDWIFLAVLLGSLLLGALRGLVYEVLSVASWGAAFMLAQWWAPDVAANRLPMAGAAEPLRYAAGFLLVTLWWPCLCRRPGGVAWSRRLMSAAMGWRPVDRALGAAFGLARGVVVIVGCRGGGRHHDAPAGQQNWWQESAGASVLTVQRSKGLKPVLPGMSWPSTCRVDGTNMCGIVGVVSNAPVNQLIYDAFAAAAAPRTGREPASSPSIGAQVLHAQGQRHGARRVPHPQHARPPGNCCGLGQVRYPTAGNAFSEEEAQPFYVNAPSASCWFTTATSPNAQDAQERALLSTDHRHINTESDSEVLLNVLAHEFRAHDTRAATEAGPDVFAAVRNVHRAGQGVVCR
jgi:membrane protein required for colicin V production